MNRGRNIKTSKSADLVSFKIFTDGDEIPASIQIESITVEKEINRIPTAQLRIIDGDTAIQDFKISNEDYFIPGKKIEIKAGYHSDEEIIFKGHIIKHSLKIRSNSSYLLIECKDQASALAIGRKSKIYNDALDSEIISEILSNTKLQADVEASEAKHTNLVQYDCSDWDFMIARAQANGKICIVDDGSVSVKTPDLKQEEIDTVAYGASLLEFDAEIDQRHQFGSISSRYWDAAQQAIVETIAESEDFELNGNISASKLAEINKPEGICLNYGGSGSADAQQKWANATALFNKMAKNRGRVRFQGIPACKPNTTMMLEGCGKRFNGKIYISAIRHEISEGQWTTDAQFGFDPMWFTDRFNICPQPAAGLFSAVHGLQIGIVTKLSGDPAGEFRIQVQCPLIEHESDGIWSRVTSLDAGENRGSFFLPEVGDEVIVGFINENPNDAVVLGMLNSSAKPSPFKATEENHEKGMITRSGMKLLFNDQDKRFSIITPAGKSLEIDEVLSCISLKDEHGNNFTMNEDGISVKTKGDLTFTADGDISLKGNNQTFTANAQFKAEGAAGAELSTGAVAVVKGSMVQIN